ncbi:MAG: sulfurtransferase TusA family protein [Magnetococcales bacterium]|nr:sulfurtransferase TusA family protein [Magnetococcales bacterium]MBF0150790.1 sulfurtransferase TusA family protein [Magnetococcales bacterium]MBF0174001.1 sulfurtransferase TusA family protein [Magnetococcales bacterium]MBF0348308.1 sulfurtransferase TusA family protein [Magnetococcales bacterium]MBF0631880.1 sulfurtransferase TusA family protein [Magnetococcales bacterium]
MPVKELNAKGLKCPQPQLKMTILISKMKPGEVIEVVADCDTFEDDVRKWCTRNQKALLWMRQEKDGAKRCQVRV